LTKINIENNFRKDIARFLGSSCRFRTTTETWFQETSNLNGKNPNGLKRISKRSILNNNRVVFNIKGKNYSLIVG
jgi:mRNA-degrading endonuclease HigB of HigAB toxin-antitoxin module